MNKIENNDAPPAAFKTFLATRKGVYPADIEEKFGKFDGEYNRLQSEWEKYSPTSAEAKIRAIRQLAEREPTSQNIAAVANLSPDEIRSSFASACNAIRTAQDKVLQAARPLVVQICEVVIPVVDKEMERIASERRAEFEKYGATFDPASDPLLKSLARWRDQTLSMFSCEQRDRDGRAYPQVVRPDQVTGRVGAIRAK